MNETTIEKDKSVDIEITKEEIIARLVKPHLKKSRLVTNEDLNRVAEEAKILYLLCFTPVGVNRGAYAMHHSQIDDKDPLSFFVTQDKSLIINPVITKHSNYFTDSWESCVSFPGRSLISVKRWPKVEIEYVTVMIDPKDENKFQLTAPIQESFKRKNAFIVQHEIGHGNAELIYPIT